MNRRALLLAMMTLSQTKAADSISLTLSRDGHWLVIRGGHLPTGEIRINYQELFQGVARCLHSDFRIGGLVAGETKTIRGKMYMLPNDPAALLKRYSQDFPSPSLRAQ